MPDAARLAAQRRRVGFEHLDVDALAVGDDGAWFAGRMRERLLPV